MRDSLGQSNVLTGFQQYVGYQSLCLLVGASASNTPPGTVAAVISSAVFETTGTTAGEITLGIPFGAPTDFLIIKASPPQSAGRSFNSDFRIISIETAVDDGSSVDFMIPYASKFGALPTGQKTFVTLTPVRADGTAGTPFPLIVVGA